MILFLFTIGAVDLLQQDLLRLVLSLDHLLHIPAIEAITMTHQLANQLEGARILRIQHHPLNQRFQTKVIHVDIKGAIERTAGGERFIPVQIGEVRRVKCSERTFQISSSLLYFLVVSAMLMNKVCTAFLSSADML